MSQTAMRLQQPVEDQSKFGDRYPRVNVLNAHFHDVGLDELVREFRRGVMLTLHTDMLVKLQHDRGFYDILDQFDVITCDSQILFFAMKALGTPVQERVSGSDFFPKYYMHHRDNADVRIFLCGGKPGIAEIARQRINAKVGREIVVGTSAPAFDFDRDPAAVDRVIDQINASGATVLVVGLGGGRQEKFIVANRHRFETIHSFLPLGGTIDYEAGTLARPPAWMTDAGLEWFYRVVREPRQRWHRYMVQDPPALWHLLKQKLGLYRDPFAPRGGRGSQPKGV